jgi:Tol biopolymer transport system component
MIGTRDGDVETMNPDGTQRALVRPDIHNRVAVSSCGDKYMVFDSSEGSQMRLVRVDADGGNPVVLVDHAFSSRCSPDGKWVMFGLPRFLYRVPIEGGTPVQIATARGGLWGAISPDSQWLAYGYQDATAQHTPRLAVVPANGGEQKYSLVRPGGSSGLQWAPDQKGLQYLLTRNGATNVWEQPLTGGAPHQVTTFTSGLITSFSWTRDGKTMLLSRGEVNSDVVMMSNFR